MRDIRSDLEERAHIIQEQMRAAYSHFERMAQQLQTDADDRVKATHLALLATDRDTKRAEAVINEVIGAARKLVEQHWPDIEKLAEQLLAEGRVNFLQPKATASEGSDSR